MRVLVLGSGVLGAAVAARVAARGHEAHVLEAGPTPASGTSATSYAWVNGNKKRPASYRELNASAIAEHHRLEGVERGWLVPNGHLEFASTDEHREELTARVEGLEAAGYPASFVSVSAAALLEPDVRVEPDALVAWFPGEAHCYPEVFVAEMLGTAGVTVETGASVVAVSAGGVELADGTVRTADRVITCLGRHTGRLHPDVPMVEPVRGNAAVGVLARTVPAPVRLSRVVTTESLNLRPAGGGALLVHALDQDPLVSPSDPVPPEVLTTLRDRIHERVGLPVALASAYVGLRSIAADGLPVVGPVGAGYVVVAHSAVTLAPLLGELAAREVCDGVAQERLAPYRVERFRLPYAPAAQMH
ncbi:NAD(P)/FAD-dependent oxidoreductase [Actinophytocola oryzae]|uniref:Glycine/D-amino acid oxidase-like deaminating enzyme n=1 Tax=Actinophytocola oryzae TaxID=502181 RepID=A0A4R7W3Y5_9PSEU|nr:FAD-dependent oxidoreductase [Actinophytocola oryzae]TDV57400.1 glycine/D-amino acid oxidase-like deaminating enzyme [Actinophytocola oryzae]